MMTEDIEIGARCSFDTLEQLKARLDLPYHIELALPHYRENWQSLRPDLEKVEGIVTHAGVRVLSVHAPGIPLMKTDYSELLEIMDLAAHLGDKMVVTFHPEKSNHNKRDRKRLEELMDRLRVESGAIPSIETFLGKTRILPFSEMPSNFYITLDTSHVSTEDAQLFVLEHAENLAVVHLSRRNGKQGHQPFGGDELWLVNLLVEKKWRGPIILEYLREYHVRYANDVHILDRIVAGLIESSW